MRDNYIAVVGITGKDRFRHTQHIELDRIENIVCSKDKQMIVYYSNDFEQMVMLEIEYSKNVVDTWNHYYK